MQDGDVEVGVVRIPVERPVHDYRDRGRVTNLGSDPPAEFMFDDFVRPPTNEIFRIEIAIGGQLTAKMMKESVNGKGGGAWVRASRLSRRSAFRL